jgi:hypothetical protein
VNPVRHGLYQHLLADAGVQALVGSRIYHVLGPVDATLPYVTFQQQTDNDVWTYGAKVQKRTLWLVKGLASSLSLAESIDEACQAALDDVDWDVSPYRMLSCRRYTGVSYPERDGGVVIQHVGSVYTVDAQP